MFRTVLMNITYNYHENNYNWVRIRASVTILFHRFNIIIFVRHTLILTINSYRKNVIISEQNLFPQTMSDLVFLSHISCRTVFWLSTYLIKQKLYYVI